MLSIRPAMDMSPYVVRPTGAQFGSGEVVQPKKKHQLDSVPLPETKRRKVSGTKQMKKWTAVENERLLFAVKKQQGSPRFEKLNFDIISKYVGTRSREQCRQRYNKTVLEQKFQVKRGQWSMDEDEKLQELVKKHMNPDNLVNWKGVKQECIGHVRRNIKQCKERWENFLSPNVNNGPFTASEDESIIYFRNSNMGWSEIAKQLNGRSQDKIKSRYNTLINTRKRLGKAMRKKQPKQETGLRTDNTPNNTKTEHTHGQILKYTPKQHTNVIPKQEFEGATLLMNQSKSHVHTKPNLEDAKLLLNQANSPQVRMVKKQQIPTGARMYNHSPVVFPYTMAQSNGYNTVSSTVTSQAGLFVSNDCTVAVPTVTLESNSLFFAPSNQVPVYCTTVPQQNFVPHGSIVFQVPRMSNSPKQYFIPVQPNMMQPTNDS